jgi:2,4-dienoyl-CoA reductase-like NADH-dependent reductase (Old Yellow Enzyme family)
MSSYPHLFSPLRIGNVTVRNRIMQTAHVKLFASGGVDSRRNLDYQLARAKGGAGLLITGNRVVHPTSTTGFPRISWAFLEGATEANRRLTDAVHEHGAVIFEQLNHFGLNASSDSADDLRTLWALGRQIARVRRDAEGDGARRHTRGRRVVGALGRALA